MVEEIRKRGIEDKRVLDALLRVKRHEFVEEALQVRAYDDCALPIGYGQTISQPYIVAKMTESLKVEPGMRVLEVGTGSGYQSAVLAEMGAEVYSVERLRPLYVEAVNRLVRLRYFNVKLKLSDGTWGWKEYAPYDRIIVTAGGPTVPFPLLKQMGEGAIMIVPVGKEKRNQRLIRIVKREGKFFKRDLGPVHFVELVGEHGWKTGGMRGIN